MKVTINGQALAMEVTQQLPLINEQEVILKKVQDVGRKFTVGSVAYGLLTAANTVLAATGDPASRIQPLIHLLQDLALPVGIIVATWGLIEIIIGNPSGKQKIKYSVFGYAGIFLIPEIFYAIRDAFRT